MIDARAATQAQNEIPPVAPPSTAVAEFDWLMSLALDDLLDAEDQARFDTLLADYPQLVETWSAWQGLDRRLDAAPHVMPVPGFTARFETRLAAEEMRQQQRVWALMAGAVLLALAIGVVVSVGIGNYVLTSHGAWFGTQVHNLMVAAATLSQWAQSLQSAVEALVNTPQARALGFVYAGLACLMALAGIQLMRRTVHLDGAAPMLGLE
jgi:anti-sigma factor RsiW